MANPNVIDYSLFSKLRTHTNNYQPTTNHFPDTVREPESDYGDDLTTKIAALLKLPLWPQCPNGAYLNPQQTTRLYQSAHGIQGLIHILNRSVYLQGVAQDYNEPNHPLTEYQRSQLWAALIELGKALVGVADEAQEQAQENL